MPMRSFEDARHRYENTKPIRGRADETIRPLSDRSAVDTYSIRKKVSGAGKVRYECWMYRTPVLTYYENDVIAFDMGGWPSASTRTFIEEVAGFTCGRKDRSSYISLPIGKVVMPKNGPTAIQLIDGKWELIANVTVYEIQLQRKAANAIRKQYKEFIDYVNNMIKLRGEIVPMYGSNAHILKMEYAEFKDALADVPDWGRLGQTESEMFKFIAEGGTENHYKAFLSLIAIAHNVRGVGNYASRFNIRSETTKEKLKELIYKHHSDEVFKRVELPVGKLPSKRYEDWVYEKSIP
jgi:hypothetical protein